jgi:hypothetical protein
MLPDIRATWGGRILFYYGKYVLLAEYVDREVVFRIMQPLLL